MESFQISAGMLSRPGDFCTFMDLTTAWSSFKLKGSVFILSASAILILGSTCSSVVVEAPPSRFWKWFNHLFFPSAAELPFTRMDGLLLSPARLFIFSQAVACYLFTCWRDIRSILPWMYSASALAWASSSFLWALFTFRSEVSDGWFWCWFLAADTALRASFTSCVGAECNALAFPLFRQSL